MLRIHKREERKVLGVSHFFKGCSLILSFILVAFFTQAPEAAITPVGHLPSVSVGLTPSIYALPILMVESRGEWQDFGIQIKLKFYPTGEDQLAGALRNEWEVGVMDPFHATKGGNEGNLGIVGVAGNLVQHLPFLLREERVLPSQDKLRTWARALISQNLITSRDFFLPVCLVATITYADTRRTLVIRWLEGYYRGLRIIQENLEEAATHLQAFYLENLKVDFSKTMLQREIEKAFFFGEKEREEFFGVREGEKNILEKAVYTLTDYLWKSKILQAKENPQEYILIKINAELIKLKKEALSQLEKTRVAIEKVGDTGMEIKEFKKEWEKARNQIQEGRGYLRIIGVLSNLQRSAEQNRVARERLRDFRKIELGIGIILTFYYAGYFFYRRKKAMRKEQRPQDLFTKNGNG